MCTLSPIFSVIVRKIGVPRKKKQRCGYQNTKTPWGCTHEGTARIFNLEQDFYKDVVGSETIHITDATGGSFYFFLRHHFNERNEEYYDEDHKMVGTLTIKATNNKQRFFSHPESTQKYNQDGSINPNHGGMVRIRVDCDDNCKCKFKQRKHMTD